MTELAPSPRFTETLTATAQPETAPVERDAAVAPPHKPAGSGARAPNAVDFWRGFALVTIFIDHVPGLVFSQYTLHNFAIFDAAEIFVFLAGWSMRLLINGQRLREAGPFTLVIDLEKRAFRIFFAQIVVAELALAIIAAGALWFQDPFILDWNDASTVFQHPVEAHVGLALLTMQIGNFNILPMYVVLMAAAPLMVLCARVAPALVLPGSLLVYGVSLITGSNLPTWPIEGHWYFNPLAWQLTFVLGFVLADRRGIGQLARAHLGTLKWIAGGILVLGMIFALRHWAPDPLSVPEPRLFFMFDKTFASPARIVSFVALAAFGGPLFHGVARFSPAAAGFFSLLGRHSLYVFCVGSILSLLARFVRLLLGNGFLIDIGIVATASVVFYVTAQLGEFGKRVPE